MSIPPVRVCREQNPLKTWEILSTPCLRNRATPQTSASRIQMWDWSMTKHSSKQSDIKLTNINTEKDFQLHCSQQDFAGGKARPTPVCFLNQIPELQGLCSVQSINLFRTRHLHSAQRNMGSLARAAVHNLWGEESALGPQKWESSKADSADTKMSYGVYAVSPDCSRQLRKSYSCLF